jgi:hypothetical protein
MKEFKQSFTHGNSKFRYIQVRGSESGYGFSAEVAIHTAALLVNRTPLTELVVMSYLMRRWVSECVSGSHTRQWRLACLVLVVSHQRLSELLHRARLQVIG